jgi:RND family efflux transporter MFP subunit
MKRLKRAFVPLAIVAAGTWAATVMIANRPHAAQVEVEVPTTLVQTMVVAPDDHVAVVRAMGVVKPERQVVIAPEVSGRVVEQNTQLVPGGRVRRGDPLIRVDSRDYTAAVAATQAELAQANLSVREENTLRRVAEHEWKDRPAGFSDETLSFALREPHLDVAQARVSSAKSRMSKARRDLERTLVRAPFDALVVAEDVEVGQSVGPGAPIATLVGIDRYWIIVSLPVAQLAHIDVPGINTDAELGSTVRVYNEPTGERHASRQGHVIRVLGSVDPRGRMAQVVVAVDDPLGVQQEVSARPSPLLIDTYVRIEIEGRPLRRVIALPRAALHDEHRVWTIDDDDRLRSTDVEIAWREPGRVFASSGLREGDRVVTTTLSIATDGMQIKQVDPAVEARGPEIAVSDASAPSAEGEQDG